ncbi:MAG: 50S ribosomal protein L18 [Candidatus Gracilibacteria bacterium]|jgi:large subunit ribosomal protein L18
MLKKITLRKKRHARIRSKISGTAERPRLVVYRSLKAIYTQLIDDTTGKVMASTSDLKVKGGTKTEHAKKIGAEIAKLALEKNITSCVFDRNGYKYHGRVKIIADTARESGLKF